MTASAPPKVRFRKTGKTFLVRNANQQRTQEFTAVESISLDIRAGEFFVLVGPSGCGKSTLLDMLGGLSRPTSGEVLVDGKEVTGPGMDRGIVFQQYALFPWRTALENIEFGLESIIPDRKLRRERAQSFLELVGLQTFAGHYPHELSGGMKQRIAIARSLAYDPEILLMDEPFAALDAQTREDLQGELVQIWKRTGKTVLFITHSIEEALVLGQRVGVMSAHPGRILKVFDIPEEFREGAQDVRFLPEFTRIRHEIWSLLQRETGKARESALVPERPITADHPSLIDPEEIIAHVP
jgi:NitT/TauT family transport system ATP-binding protein